MVAYLRHFCLAHIYMRLPFYWVDRSCLFFCCSSLSTKYSNFIERQHCLKHNHTKHEIECWCENERELFARREKSTHKLLENANKIYISTQIIFIVCQKIIVYARAAHSSKRNSFSSSLPSTNLHINIWWHSREVANIGIYRSIGSPFNLYRCMCVCVCVWTKYLTYLPNLSNIIEHSYLKVVNFLLHCNWYRCFWKLCIFLVILP